MAFQTGTRVDPRLGALDFSGFTNAANIQAKALSNLGATVSEAITDYKEKKEQKILDDRADKFLVSTSEGETQLGNALRGLGIIDKETARVARKSLGDNFYPALQTIMESNQTDDFATAQNLESPQQFLLPPDENNPAGRNVFGGMATEGPMRGRPVYSPGPGEPFKMVPPGTTTYDTGLRNNVEKNLQGAKDTIAKEQDAIFALKNYYDTRSKTPQGIEFLLKDIQGKLKTTLGVELDEDELRTQIGRGQFQGLLGRIRLDILGGGVLTENDAKRLEQALGKYGTTSDPEVVRQVLATIIKSKKAKELNAFNTYDLNVKRDPMLFQLYKDNPFTPIDVSGVLGNEETNESSSSVSNPSLSLSEQAKLEKARRAKIK